MRKYENSEHNVKNIPQGKVIAMGVPCNKIADMSHFQYVKKVLNIPERQK